jgi:pimeloyl-ACP methyl ester carboxylesterase
MSAAKEKNENKELNKELNPVLNKDSQVYSVELGPSPKNSNPENSNPEKGAKKPLPLIMLHGWGQTMGSLWGLGDLFSKSRKVYLIDLPGFGKSPKPPVDWDTEEYARCMLQFMDEHKIDRADILGHSFGGRVAIRMANLAPKRLDKIILINSAGLKRTIQGKALVRSKVAKTSANVCKFLDRTFALNTFQEWHVPKFASRDYRTAGELKNTFVKTVNEDLSEIAKHIESPVLLLWGEKDAETPIDIAQRYAELIPRSKLIVLPGKDHFPFLNEGAHLCAYHILKFFDETGPSEARIKKGEEVSV